MWQNRKVLLLEVELLVSSEMLFLFKQSCCMCILGDQMLCLRYCFALCKINLFSVKPLWGFFGIVKDDILAVIVFRKTICF